MEIKKRYPCWGESCKPARSPADGGLKNFQTGGQPVHFGLPAPCQNTHTHTHTQIHTVGHFSVRLCDFSTHAIQAWQRMSGCLPVITHLRRENQQWPRKTRRTDWSQIGTRPPNQRDMPGHIVESKEPITAPGLTISQSGHNERPPFLCLSLLKSKNKKKVWKRLHDNKKTAQTDTQPPPPAHPAVTMAPQRKSNQQAKKAWCMAALRYVHFLFLICRTFCWGREWMVCMCVLKGGGALLPRERVMTVPLIENHYKQL